MDTDRLSKLEVKRMTVLNHFLNLINHIYFIQEGMQAGRHRNSDGDMQDCIAIVQLNPAQKKKSAGLCYLHYPTSLLIVFLTHLVSVVKT